TRLVAEVREGLLQVQGNRIVDLRRNAAGAEMFAEVVAAGGANRELIVDMNEVRRGNGQRYFRFQMEFAEELAITIGIALPGCCPGIEIFQFHAEDGGLKGVQAAIHTQQLVDIFVAGTVHMQELETIGQGSVAGSNNASIAGGTKILGGEKTEATH